MLVLLWYDSERQKFNLVKFDSRDFQNIESFSRRSCFPLLTHSVNFQPLKWPQIDGFWWQVIGERGRRADNLSPASKWWWGGHAASNRLIFLQNNLQFTRSSGQNKNESNLLLFWQSKHLKGQSAPCVGHGFGSHILGKLLVRNKVLEVYP